MLFFLHYLKIHVSQNDMIQLDGTNADWLCIRTIKIKLKLCFVDNNSNILIFHSANRAFVNLFRAALYNNYAFMPVKSVQCKLIITHYSELCICVSAATQ